MRKECVREEERTKNCRHKVVSIQRRAIACSRIATRYDATREWFKIFLNSRISIQQLTTFFVRYDHYSNIKLLIIRTRISQLGLTFIFTTMKMILRRFGEYTLTNNLPLHHKKCRRYWSLGD